MKLLNSRTYILVALFIGVVYAFTIFEPFFIMGNNAYWKEPYGDCIHNLIGALYFVHDGWRWPLFYVPGLAFPEGANIIYTDSIPLLALAMKVIYKITGEWFNYFGFWLFACFPLLALFIALATKEAGGKDPIAIISAVLCALASPALLVRFGHAALMAHFLIAWSFLLYLKFGRTSSLCSSTLQFALVASLSVVLQAYFLLMVMPFFIAALIQSKTESRMSLRDTILSFSVVAGSIIFVAVIAGIIGPGSSITSAWGFGHYSMNVMSPFLPPREHLPSFVAKLITWDGNGYSWDATGGQYEGYNYLGAGVLVLIITHIAFSRNLIQQTIKRNKFLVLMLVCLLLLALSTRVFIGSWLFLNLTSLNDLIKPLIGNFRTSGRFFWPIYYVLVVFLVLLTFKRFSPNMARAVIIAAVVIQMIDTQPLRHNMAQTAGKGYQQVLPKQAWRELLNVHKFVKQYPSFQCGGWANNHWPENNSNMEMLLMAAELDKPINSAYLARRFRNCQDEFTEGLKFEIQNEGLYIYSGRTMSRYIEKLPDFKQLCREFEFGFICSRKWASLPQINKSFTIDFKKSAWSGVISRTSGLSFAEAWGTWSSGDVVTLEFSFPLPEKFTIHLVAHAFGPNVGKEFVAHVGDSAIRFKLTASPEERVLEFSNPKRSRTIKIDIPAPASPKELGLSADDRSLGIAFTVLRIVLL